MKHLKILSVLWLITAGTACNKKNDVVIMGDTLPHTILSFELVDKSGKSLITSINDKVTITYISLSGATITLPNISVEKLQVPDIDTNASIKYNGFWINDHASMVDAELATFEPINHSKAFNISLNGKGLGSIYFDYYSFAKYPALSSSALTLNSMPAVQDRNVGGDMVVWVFTANN